MNAFEDYSLIEQMISMLNSEDKALNDESFSAARQIKDFIDRLPGGFLIYKADGGEEIIYANRALLRMFRCNTLKEFKEYTGNSFRGIVYYEDLDAVEASIQEQIASSQENLDYVEYRILGKDGAIRWVEDYGHYVRTHSIGNIFYVFITDATEKINKRRQEHLQRLEVIEGLSINYDSILYVDLDANTVRPYRLSNRLKRQFTKKLEVRKYDGFAEEFVDCWVHPDDKQKIKSVLTPDYIRDKLKENPTFYTNFKCLEDGETKYLQLRIVDVRNDGHVSQVVIGSRNIEDEIAQEMKQKNLLERALKEANLAYVAKNTFLSNMSHDMRTPLNALFGYLELAKKNINDKKALENYLNKVSATGRQLLDLVDKVLELSYLESKDFQLSEELCSIRNITTELYGKLAPEAAKKNISLSLEYKNAVHTDVFTDRDKLKQVLIHIAGNAIKYTGKNGKVNLTVEEKLSTSSEYATFNFITRDTGIGIDKNSLGKIFEPFEREHNSTQSGIFGSGLGLTIAKQIIESMGGTITAESDVGKGSTFTVTLSFRSARKNDIPNEEENIAERLNGKKILLVEDNEINLEIETEMLQDLGLIIEPAENGKIAVEKVKASAPGEYLFVLMDIQMPVMDGRQATEEIRKLDNPELAGIPIIALSANALESDKRLSVKTGMDAHLTKPIDIPVLLKTLSKTLKFSRTEKK